MKLKKASKQFLVVMLALNLTKLDYVVALYLTMLKFSTKSAIDNRYYAGFFKARQLKIYQGHASGRPWCLCRHLLPFVLNQHQQEKQY